MISSHELKPLIDLLEECRQQGNTITYLEVADTLAINPPQRIQQVAHQLETLMEFDVSANRPLRSALVVSRSENNIPRHGFFLKAQSLGIWSGDAKQAFHQACISQLLAQT